MMVVFGVWKYLFYVYCSDSLSAAVLLFLLIVVAYPKDNTTPYRLNSVLKDILTK